MSDLKLARQGMLLLLERFPDEMIVKYDAQVYEAPRTDGPWVCIDLSNGLKFAIWKETGNVYSVNDDGSVEDEVIISVTPL